MRPQSLSCIKAVPRDLQQDKERIGESNSGAATRMYFGSAGSSIVTSVYRNNRGRSDPFERPIDGSWRRGIATMGLNTMAHRRMSFDKVYPIVLVILTVLNRLDIDDTRNSATSR